MITEGCPMRGRLFTPTEAAALTQLSLKAVNNAIDKELISIVEMPSGDAPRRLRIGGVLALALERRLSSYLLPGKRRLLFRVIEARPYMKRLTGGVIRIDLRKPRRALAAALRCLRRSRALVTEDKETLGGHPVFAGTRIPVHVVAKMLAEEVNEASVRHAYPRLTAEMIRLAPLYAAAYPLRGRPPKPRALALVSKRTIRKPLKSS
jgi:uncharacterized protein (DUF433 family)